MLFTNLIPRLFHFSFPLSFWGGEANDPGNEVAERTRRVELVYDSILWDSC